jgi:hypothetical protein
VITQLPPSRATILKCSFQLSPVRCCCCIRLRQAPTSTYTTNTSTTGGYLPAVTSFACSPANCCPIVFLQAIAGTDPHIHIISVAEAAVIAQLPLPAGTAAVELSAAADQGGLLLVLCKDGTMQLWQVALGLCCCSLKTDAFTAVRGLHNERGCIPHECCTRM